MCRVIDPRVVVTCSRTNEHCKSLACGNGGIDMCSGA